MAMSAVISGQTVDNYKQDSVLYLTDEQEAFMIDKETKYLIKTGPLAYEQKLSESFSINTSIIPFYSTDNGFGIRSDLELRYYYKLSKLIKEGKQANNLSSEYFSAGVGYDGSPFIGDGRKNVSFNYNINWGSQRRFLNTGYVDMGIELSYNTYENISSTGDQVTSSLVTLQNRSIVGVAFGKNYEISDVVKCPIFKCHLDRKSAMKFNLNKTFSMSYGSSSLYGGGNQFSASLNPEISYEKKLGSSAFSIDQELEIFVGASTRISNLNTSAGISEYSLGYTVALRHYYNLNKNIKKGESGNNLSGNYWYLGSSFQFGDSKLTFNDGNDVIGKQNYLGIPFGLGFQKTMLDSYYFDFQFGVNIKINETIATGSPSIGGSRAVLDFKVGKIF